MDLDKRLPDNVGCWSGIGAISARWVFLSAITVITSTPESPAVHFAASEESLLHRFHEGEPGVVGFGVLDDNLVPCRSSVKLLPTYIGIMIILVLDIFGLTRTLSPLA
jgi:hypothetical protein